MDPTFGAAAGATVINVAESFPAIDSGEVEDNSDMLSETLSASDAPDPFAAYDALFARWH